MGENNQTNINISGSVQGGNVNLGGNQTFGKRLKVLTPKGRYEIDIVDVEGELHTNSRHASDFKSASEYAYELLNEDFPAGSFITRVERKDRI